MIISTKIEERQVELDAFILEYFGTDDPVSPPVERNIHREEIPDGILIARIISSNQDQRFSDMYFNGALGGYSSQSEADLAMCNWLAFWTAKNPEQMDRLFRQSELMRDKWDEKHGAQTYGAMTIQKAIEGTRDTYSGGQDRTSSAERKPDTKHRFQLIHYSKIAFKKPDWLVMGLMERDSSNLIFSDPGVGKSFWAIDLASSIATGKEFHGNFVKQGAVAFIAGEGQNGLKRRFMAWSIRHGINLDDHPLFIATMPASLLDPESADQVIMAADAIAAENGPLSLIVIDTVARNFGPGDENSTKDMGMFIQAVDDLRIRHQAAILLVHHTGHADKSRGRGSMALKGALDAEFRLTKDDDGIIRMDCTKCKDHAPPEPMAFKLRTVELPLTDNDGRPITSAVLDPAVYEPLAVAGKAGRGKYQAAAKNILVGLCDHHRKNLEAEGRDPDGAKISVTEWKDACLGSEIPRNRFYDLKKTLTDLGEIEIENGFVYVKTQTDLSGYIDRSGYL